MTNLKNYLEAKVNSRGNKNLNYLGSFFSETELAILSNKTISIVGTNGKNSTIQACFSILKQAGIKCNVYTSPHIQKINERFVYNNKQLNDEKLASLFEEVEKINDNKPL